MPRTGIHALEVHASLEEVAQSFVESGFPDSSVGVELDRIIGILYNKDVFKALQEKPSLTFAIISIRRFLFPARCASASCLSNCSAAASPSLWWLTNSAKWRVW